MLISTSLSQRSFSANTPRGGRSTARMILQISPTVTAIMYFDTPGSRLRRPVQRGSPGCTIRNQFLCCGCRLETERTSAMVVHALHAQYTGNRRREKDQKTAISFLNPSQAFAGRVGPFASILVALDFEDLEHCSCCACLFTWLNYLYNLTDASAEWGECAALASQQQCSMSRRM